MSGRKKSTSKLARFCTRGTPLRSRMSPRTAGIRTVIREPEATLAVYSAPRAIWTYQSRKARGGRQEDQDTEEVESVGDLPAFHCRILRNGRKGSTMHIRPELDHRQLHQWGEGSGDEAWRRFARRCLIEENSCLRTRSSRTAGTENARAH